MTQPLTAQQYYPQPGGANAVSINIYNPQAYANAPAQLPQAAPYNYTNSLYSMPQASTYQQPQVQAPMTYQQFMPVQQQYQPIAPAPQLMPQSVMEQPVVENTYTPQQPVQQIPQAPIAAETVQNNQVAPETVQAPAVEVVEDQADKTPVVDVDRLTKGLLDNDVDNRAATINEIADYAQKKDQGIALQVVSEPIMNALINIINEDTTSLEGPNDKQIEVAEKIARGEQLTAEEEALSEDLSPRDKANKNRIFALYTLAMIQKLQRDELNQYIEDQKANGQKTIDPMQINELLGYDDIVNIIKNDSRPEVKVAAMQALQYIAEPQDKAEVEKALEESLNSDDETIKLAAQDVVDRFAE